MLLRCNALLIRCSGQSGTWRESDAPELRSRCPPRLSSRLQHRCSIQVAIQLMPVMPS